MVEGNRVVLSGLLYKQLKICYAHLLESSKINMFLVVFLLNLLAIAEGFIREIPLPNDYQQCYDQIAAKTDFTKTVGHLIFWHCKEKCSMKLDKAAYNHTITADWFEKLLTTLDVGKSCKSKKVKPRIRQEIRRLTRGQWKRLVDAILKLKTTPYKDTNRYDYIASFHTGNLIPIAHFGPNFLVWHRLYMLLYENALRQIDPSVTLPYWDVTIDIEMENPVNSIMWTEEFMGNADGVVTTGPFKNWQTPDGLLFRNIGQFGSYFDKDYLEQIFALTRFEDISAPTAQFQNTFEFAHGGPHVFVDGIFGNINRAAYDPIFFFYHCFVDYVYEKIRESGLKAGVDIENDWTSEYNDFHAPGATSGLGDIPNTQGRSNYYTDCVFRYAKTPACSAEKPSCGSDYLWCNQIINRCVSFSEEEFVNKTCRGQHKYGFVNSFCIDGECEMNKWVYIPVEVIQFRPPGHSVAKTMKLSKGKFLQNSDIYEAENTTDLKVNPAANKIATYKKCKAMDSYDDVIVESTGLNYFGFYQEVAKPDNRLPISKSMIYLAVKKPGKTGTRVLINAADKCGCECKILCRRYGSQTYYPCSGAFYINNRHPYLYGNSVEEMVQKSWNLHGYPIQIHNNIMVKVLCDYSVEWIWSRRRPSNSLWSSRRPSTSHNVDTKTQPYYLQHMYEFWNSLNAYK